MKLSIFTFLMTLTLVQGQNTLQLQEGEASPKASLKDVSWLQGHWKGEALGGIAEEIWSPPLGESMMFVFRLVHDQTVSFYEIGHIKEVDGTILMQLKHFDGALKGWEEKDQTVDFKLIKLENDRAFFEGLTFERNTKNSINIYVMVKEGDKTEEIEFQYQRMMN